MSLTFTFSGNKNDEFNGVFTGLSQSGSVNIFPSLIEVTESSFSGSNNKGVHAITNKWGIGSRWNSGAPAPSSWLLVDFKDNLFQLSSYSIKSHNGFNQFRSYDFKASNDHNSWTNLHSIYMSSIFCPNLISQNFAVNNEHSFRYFLIQSTGSACNSGERFIIQDLEFFGTLNPAQISINNSSISHNPKSMFHGFKYIYNIFITILFLISKNSYKYEP